MNNSITDTIVDCGVETDDPGIITDPIISDSTFIFDSTPVMTIDAMSAVTLNADLIYNGKPINEHIKTIIAEEMKMYTVKSSIGIMDISLGTWVAILILMILVVRLSRTATWTTILYPLKWAWRAVKSLCIWGARAVRRDVEGAKRAWDEIE